VAAQLCGERARRRAVREELRHLLEGAEHQLERLHVQQRGRLHDTRRQPGRRERRRRDDVAARRLEQLRRAVEPRRVEQQEARARVDGQQRPCGRRRRLVGLQQWRRVAQLAVARAPQQQLPVTVEGGEAALRRVAAHRVQRRRRRQLLPVGLDERLQPQRIEVGRAELQLRQLGRRADDGAAALGDEGEARVLVAARRQRREERRREHRLLQRPLLKVELPLPRRQDGLALLGRLVDHRRDDELQQEVLQLPLLGRALLAQLGRLLALSLRRAPGARLALAGAPGRGRGRRGRGRCGHRAACGGCGSPSARVAPRSAGVDAQQ